MDPVRQKLEELIAARGDDYLGLSRLLGRNPAYMQQFLKRGSPRKLDEGDRKTLARYFGVDEAELGGPKGSVRAADPVTMIPRLELGASAGPGAAVDSEGVSGRFGFDPRWLRKIGANPASLSIIQVAGDSMAPTLGDGDDILVDRSETADRLRPGIYVIRIDDNLLVKRLAKTKGGFAITSDNPAYPPVKNVGADRLQIIGRVIWAGRSIH